MNQHYTDSTCHSKESKYSEMVSLTVEVALLEVVEVRAIEVLSPVLPELTQVPHALHSTVQSVQIDLAHGLCGTATSSGP